MAVFSRTDKSQALLPFSEAQDFILREVQRSFWPAKGAGTTVAEFRVTDCIMLFNPLNNPCELDVIPSLQLRNAGLREIKEFTQAHTASRCQNFV